MAFLRFNTLMVPSQIQTFLGPARWVFPSTVYPGPASSVGIPLSVVDLSYIPTYVYYFRVGPNLFIFFWFQEDKRHSLNNSNHSIATLTLEVLALCSFCSSTKYSLTDLLRPTSITMCYPLITPFCWFWCLPTVTRPFRAFTNLPSQHVALSVLQEIYQLHFPSSWLIALVFAQFAGLDISFLESLDFRQSKSSFEQQGSLLLQPVGPQSS